MASSLATERAGKNASGGIVSYLAASLYETIVIIAAEAFISLTPSAHEQQGLRSVDYYSCAPQ